MTTAAQERVEALTIRLVRGCESPACLRMAYELKTDLSGYERGAAAMPIEGSLLDFAVEHRTLPREPYPGRPAGVTNLWILRWK